MIAKSIMFCNQPCILICDGKCNKAWGYVFRLKNQLSDNDNEDEDNFEYLSDLELGEASIDPGTYEGGQGKPFNKLLNKWCARECERSVLVKDNEEFELPDFNKRVKNIN